MPGKELSDPIDPQSSPPFALLKSHKAFPRRSAAVEHNATFLASTHLQRQEKEQETLAKSAAIESWIPEPDVIHLALSHSLPLTPPDNSPEVEGTSWIDGPLPDDNKVTTRSVSSGINTPIIQRSPPTPETTPPKARQQESASSPVYQRMQSSGTRTDSFKTAREDVSSDEDRQPDSPSMRPARQKWLQQTAHARLRDIGLGLGLESKEDAASLHELTPKRLPSKDDFVAFDGTWGASTDLDAPVSNHGPAATITSAPSKSRATKTPQVPKKSPQKSPKAFDDAAPLSRSLSLRQRLEQSRQSPPSVSTERFAAEINWPLQEDETSELKARIREMDVRRFSQMSGTSTVEAVVIDTPAPKRRQTLRHTGKIVTLDSPGDGSRRNSIILKHDQPRRRQLRHTGSPDQVKRGSIASDVSFSMTSSQPRKRQNSIPVIVIPERKSSLKSSAPSSRRLSRTVSLTSRQQSTRPTTAPDDTTGYFDLPRRERRTISAVISPVAPPKPEAKMQKKMPPDLVSEPIAMSANTSRKVSRANSTKSTNVRTYNGLQEHPTYIQPPASNDESQDAQNNNVQITGFDRSTMADWSALRPRSTQVTPFSLRSAHSSTPGTLEVNEATAISIYPHTNKSILVVQQLPREDSSQPPEHSAVVASNASFAIPGPHAPAVIHQARARQLLDSPLRNPRQPPQPPDFKVIPPTPVPNPSPTKDDERSPRRSSSSNTALGRLGKPITIVKRALSARRYSETFVAPLTRSLSRRTTIITRRPSVASDPDNKLHPFWRPRGFWDDLSESDSDSEFGNSGFLVGNSLGMPLAHTTTKITAQQPPRRSVSLTQRLSNSMGFPRRNSKRRNSLHIENRRIYRRTSYETDNDLNRSYEFIKPQPDPSQGRHLTAMPRLGYQVHFVGLKGLAEKMEKRKERRGEERRERVREKLRGSIGPVVPIQGGTQGYGAAGYGRGL